MSSSVIKSLLSHRERETHLKVSASLLPRLRFGFAMRTHDEAEERVCLTLQTSRDLLVGSTFGSGLGGWVRRFPSPSRDVLEIAAVSNC